MLPKPEALIAPTPRDTIYRDGTANLYRFRPSTAGAKESAAGAKESKSSEAKTRMPILLVPSLINRWYILDLRTGASAVEAFVDYGHDTFLLDWGVPNDEDRYLTWDNVIDRLGRMVRAVKRETGAEEIGLLGYCLGSTLCSIYAALNPDDIAAFVNLAGPIDFEKGGRLTEMTNPDWFDAEAIAQAGNVSPEQMQSAFVALRPTLQISKWVTLASRGMNKNFQKAFVSLEAWSNDNIPFPAAAYVTYIEELYQQNKLVEGEHYVHGRRVDLGEVRCPVLVVGAERDNICPMEAAEGINHFSGSNDTSTLMVPGGHVGAVVGSRAAKQLYPAIVRWFDEKLLAAETSRKKAA